MKGFSRFAKHCAILLSLLLAAAWLYYYLYLYAYLPDRGWADSCYAFVQILLYAVPVCILLLLFSLLWIRKPRFRRLNTSISIYLSVLFLLHLAASIYNSHHYSVTDCFCVTSLQQDHESCYVTVSDQTSSTLLHCRSSYFKHLTQGDSYHIHYLGNDLFKQIPPTILSIEQIK